MIRGDRSYGEILRSERERAGYDITSMSRRIHVRPDILQAIENSDFDRMPARGYSKNMVRAYARALKLDEGAITAMYLDEVHLHEVGVPRMPRSHQRSAPASRRVAESGAGGRQRASADFGRGRPSSRQGRQNPRAGTREGRGFVDSNHDGSYSRPSSAPPRSAKRPQRGAPQQGRQRQQAADAPGFATRAAGGIGSIVNSIGSRGRRDTKVPRSFNTIGSTPPYAQNNSKGSFSFANMNLPMLLAIVAAIIILIIVIVVITNGNKQASEEVPNIPISGLTDTSSPEEELTQPSVSAETPPTSAEFTIEVADGQQSWVEIYQNGSTTPEFAAALEGPDTETYEVTGTLLFKTANPAAITAKLNGEAVELKKESGSGYYTFTVDFAQILSDWNAAHSEGEGADSSSSSSAASASSKASSSSSSATSSKSSSSKSSASTSR